jgi:hypothetical protein
MPDLPPPDNPFGSGVPGDRGSGPRSKGPVRFVIACSLIVFVAVLWWLDLIPWDDKPPPPAVAAYKLIKAGAVAPLSSTPGKIVGQFIVEPDARPDPQADRSLGSGGACLVADFGQFMTSGQSCTAHSECSAKWEAYYDSIKDDNKFTPGDATTVGFTRVGAGYCVQGSCRYRPWVNACQRRPWRDQGGNVLGAWPDGPHEVTLPSTDFLKKMYGPDVQLNWSVVACANRASTAANPPTEDQASCPYSAGIYDPPQQ